MKMGKRFRSLCGTRLVPGYCDMLSTVSPLRAHASSAETPNSCSVGKEIAAGQFPGGTISVTRLHVGLKDHLVRFLENKVFFLSFFLFSVTIARDWNKYWRYTEPEIVKLRQNYGHSLTWIKTPPPLLPIQPSLQSKKTTTRNNTTHTRTHGARTHSRTHVHTHTHADTHIHTHTHERTHACTQTHTHMHTHAHTYTHTQTQNHENITRM